MINFSTALQGMSCAETRLDRMSQRVAKDPAAAADPNLAVDTVDARNQFTANLDTAKVSDQMTQKLLNLLA